LEVTGDDELKRILNLLGRTYGDSFERRVARSAIAGGLSETVKIERSGTGSKRHRKAIKSRFKRNKRTGVHEAKAGANVGGKGNAAPDIHFELLGTNERKTKSGANRGRIKAVPWIRRTVNQGRTRIQLAMRRAGQKRFNKERAKLFKRG